MKENEALISEFDSLRTEILDHQSRREKLFLFTITALGAVLGFIINSSGISFIIVSFLPYFIIYNFCKTAYIQSIHIITMGTYIRNYIAPYYEIAFRWEVIWDLKAKKDAKDKSVPRGEYLKGGGYWFYFCLLTTIFTCVGISCLTLFSYKHFLTTNQLYIAIFISLHVLMCILTIIFGVLKIHWGRLNRKFRKQQNDMWLDSKKLLEEEQKNKAEN